MDTVLFFSFYSGVLECVFGNKMCSKTSELRLHGCSSHFGVTNCCGVIKLNIEVNVLSSHVI